MTEIERLLSGTDRVETSGELEAKLSESRRTGRPLRVKFGIDATGPDIHLGFAVGLRKLRQFQDAGHLAVLIVGDFTAKIGDPTGRSKVRPQLTDADVARNMERYKEQIFRIIDPGKCEFRHNSEWCDSLSAIEVVRLASKCTVARITERDDFRKRLNEGLPVYLHELLYPLFQGYDSVAVEADVELGGADQYWNLLVGRELQREFGQQPQVVMTVPLLVGLDGVQKMSKSYGNYIAITERASEMYGKLMSIPDTLILDYYRLCTNLHDEELGRIAARLKGGENPRNIKAELARAVVALYHGASEAEAAAVEFDRVFRDRQLPAQVPEFAIPPSGMEIVELLVRSGLTPSKSEARRKLAEGAVYVNGRRVQDETFVLRIGTESSSAEAGAAQDGSACVIKVGKRRFLRLVQGA